MSEFRAGRAILHGVVIMLGGWGIGQEPTAADPALEPANFDPAAMTRRLEALRPDIEALLGDGLGAPIEVLATSAQELVPILVEENVLVQCHLLPSADPAGVRRRVRVQALRQAPGLFGKVDLAGGRIRILPQTVKEIARLTNQPERVRSQGFLDLVLAHEAAHVHQIRRKGLSSSFGTPSSPEHFLGIQAASEGHAEWVTRRFAERRGLAETHAVYRSLFREFPDNGGDPVAAMIAEVFMRILSFPYVEGATFHDAIVQALGPSAAYERVMTDTPLDQSLIRRPDVYLARSPALPPRARAPEARRVDGVVLIDDRAPDGAVEVHLWVGAPVHEFRVAYGEGGRFSVELPASAPIRAGLVIVAGEPRIDVIGDLVPVEDGGSITLRLGTSGRIPVRVTDLATGEPLPGARVYPRRSADRIRWLGREPGLEVKAAGPPPFALPPPEVGRRTPRVCDDDGSTLLDRSEDDSGAYVTADGHAWEVVDWSELTGSQGSVALRPGGALEIEVPAWDRLREPRVYSQYLSRTDSGTFELRAPEELPMVVKGSRLEITGLPIAVHVITIRSGRWYANGPVYDSRPLTLTSHAAASYRVEVAEIDVTADRSVILNAPDAWGALRRYSALLTGTGARTRGIERSSVIRWEPGGRSGRLLFKGIVPGSYDLEVSGLGWTQSVDVPDGDAEVEVALPEPVEVVVLVRDEVTKRPVAGGRVEWQPRRKESLRRFSPGPMTSSESTARIDARTGTARFLVAPGGISVTPVVEGGLSEETYWEIPRTTRVERVLDVLPAGWIRVILRKEGALFRGEAEVRIERIKEPGGATSFGDDQSTNASGRFEFPGRRPGRFRVWVAKVVGASLPQAVEVEVKARETAEVVLDLDG